MVRPRHETAAPSLPTLNNAMFGTAEFSAWWAADDDETSAAELKTVSKQYVWIAPATMVYHLFDEPQWFKQMGAKGYPLYVAGLVIVWTVNILIITSTFAFCLESLPAFCTEKDTGRCTNSDPEFYATLWLIIESGCVIVFTGDFLTRLVCCIIMGKKDFARFRGDPMNYIDVVAVFPFYIQLLWSWIFPATCQPLFAGAPNADVASCAAVTALEDDSACRGVMGSDSDFATVSVCTYTQAREVIDLRFVRVLRLARVLHSLPEKYAGMGGIVMDILRTAAMPLILPVYFMILACIVFASMAYYVEAPVNEICYFDGDTSNGVVCEGGKIPGQTCNKISGWLSLPTVADGSAFGIPDGSEFPGNEGCLTDGGCGCNCDDQAHIYRKAQLYYDSCRSVGVTSEKLAAEFEALDGAPTCASWLGRSEAEAVAYLPSDAGECTGVITYETWDNQYHPAEYTSDMFADGAPGGIFTAAWWCVVTFTTVGYGDMNPRTPQGQVIAVITMLTGVFFLAMPLAVVGGSFQSAWNRAEAEHELLENSRQLAQARKDGKPPPPAIPTSREMYDAMYGDPSVRAIQDVKANIAAMLAKSEHLRELAGGLEEHVQVWKKVQGFQRKLKEISVKLGDDSTIVTESFLGPTYAKRDENGDLIRGVRGNWWGHIPEHVSERSKLEWTQTDDVTKS